MTTCPYCNVGGNPIAIERHIAAVHVAEEAARLRQPTCREQGNHFWEPLSGADLDSNGNTIAYDRCGVCGTTRQTAITGRSYEFPPATSAAQLAADLQALRSELQEEVTS